MGWDSVACSSCFLRDSEASSLSTWGKHNNSDGVRLTVADGALEEQGLRRRVCKNWPLGYFTGWRMGPFLTGEDEYSPDLNKTGCRRQALLMGWRASWRQKEKLQLESYWLLHQAWLKQSIRDTSTSLWKVLGIRRGDKDKQLLGINGPTIQPPKTSTHICWKCRVCREPTPHQYKQTYYDQHLYLSNHFMCLCVRYLVCRLVWVIHKHVGTLTSLSSFRHSLERCSTQRKAHS